MILAGDVGGTKIHLALSPGPGRPPGRPTEVRLATSEVASLPDALATFAREAGGSVSACALGVAGPVVGAEVHGTNLPWTVRAAEISSALGGAPVQLLNDLEAAAYALDDLAPGELEVIQAGEAVPGANLALLSPGTGLGESIVLHRAGRTYPVGSEGGHADFAPRTDEEIDLLRHLRDRWGRVSVERVVSGPGLVNVFCWLRDAGRVRDDSGLEAALGDSAPAARISAAALAGGGGICREALRVWVGALAAEAGSLVLRGFALGGLFLGGGIPPQVLPALRSATFRTAFRDKAPHAEALARVPVHVVLATEMTLRGALRAAAESGDPAGTAG